MLEFLNTSGKHVREINTPLIPHFYIVKLGYAEVYLFFLFLLQDIDCGYSLEPPQFLQLCILHGHVFVMRISETKYASIPQQLHVS